MFITHHKAQTSYFRETTCSPAHLPLQSSVLYLTVDSQHDVNKPFKLTLISTIALPFIKWGWTWINLRSFLVNLCRSRKMGGELTKKPTVNSYHRNWSGARRCSCIFGWEGCNWWFLNTNNSSMFTYISWTGQDWENAHGSSVVSGGGFVSAGRGTLEQEKQGIETKFGTNGQTCPTLTQGTWAPSNASCKVEQD